MLSVPKGTRSREFRKLQNILRKGYKKMPCIIRVDLEHHQIQDLYLLCKKAGGRVGVTPAVVDGETTICATAGFHDPWTVAILRRIGFEELDPRPTLLYHVTQTSNVTRIMKDGLKSGRDLQIKNGKGHIHLWGSVARANEWIETLFGKLESYTVLEVDVSDIKVVSHPANPSKFITVESIKPARLTANV
jgi:hypothetical protein